MSPKYFMRECKKIAQANGWSEGYEQAGNCDVIRSEIIALAKREGIYNTAIGHHFPNTGTYTYDDGIIDYSLGAINPISEIALHLQASGIPFALTF